MIQMEPVPVLLVKSQHAQCPYDDKSIFQVYFGLDLGLELFSLFGFGILACSFLCIRVLFFC